VGFLVGGRKAGLTGVIDKQKGGQGTAWKSPNARGVLDGSHGKTPEEQEERREKKGQGKKKSKVFGSFGNRGGLVLVLSSHGVGVEIKGVRCRGKNKGQIVVRTPQK